ncbi:MAG TPA: ATP-binding protein [Actinomycetota bacterium]
MRRGLFPRGAERRVHQALADTRVVAIVGPRQVGKTTLVRELIQRDQRASFFTLDDPVVLEAVRADPAALVADRRGLVVFDEVQRAPELMLAIKLAVDEDRRPGQFLLTGSADLLSVRGLADALAGRIELIDLLPLTQGELEGKPSRFIDQILTGRFRGLGGTRPDKRDYLRRAVAGGFPEAIARPEGRRRGVWFESYAKTVTEREVPNLVDLFRIRDLPRLLRLVAARHASVLNVADLARDAGIPERTVHRYLDVLEGVYLIRRVRAWSGNLTAREARQPKIYITDSGLAAHLRGATTERLMRSVTSHGTDGPILEGLVVGELMAQSTWAATLTEIFHYRDRDGREVDVLVEANDGAIVGLEVKASSTVRSDDFRSLAFLRDRLHDRFVLGVVLYAGQRTLSFGERLRALPIAALWQVSTKSSTEDSLGPGYGVSAP